MKTKTYRCDRLTRDRTLERLENVGGTVTHRILARDAFEHELRKKLLEEAHELLDARTTEEQTSEFADVLEVLAALQTFYTLDQTAIEHKRAEKMAARGGFANGLFIETMELPVGSSFEVYCSENKDKYPEVKR